MNIKSISIYSTNIPKSLEFWIDKIGMSLVEKDSNNQYFYAKFEGMSFNLVVVDKNLVEESIKNNKPSILFSTPNLDLTRENLIKNGVKVLSIELHPIGKVFTFFDNEGNAYAMCEE